MGAPSNRPGATTYVVAPVQDHNHDAPMREDEASGPQASVVEKAKLSKSKGNTVRETTKLTPRRVFHLLRRVLVFAAAIVYLNVSISACIDSIHVLRGGENPPMDFVTYEAHLMAAYAGTTTMRQSPLVTRVLKDETAPRTDTLYLEDATTTSFTTCTRVKSLPAHVYTNEFQRSLFDHLAHDTAYNITLFDPQTLELIVPVVDCSCSSIVYEDTAGVRFFYLMRSVRDHDDVYLLAITLSVQEYTIVERNEHGSSAMVTLAFLNDLQATEVTHHFCIALGYPFYLTRIEVYDLIGTTSESSWRLRSVPPEPHATPKVVQTSSRTGFYISSETAQANIKNTVWTLSQSPVKTIGHWEWTGQPVLRDSWGWTHCLHAVLAANVLVNLAVLLKITLRNAQRGRLWIGDAFVSVSTSLWLRSALVLLSWYIDKFWAVIEFCMHEGNLISATQGVFIYPSIMRADLLAVYFCVVSVIGVALKERIDPALAIGLFYIGFDQRLAVLRHFPSLVAMLTTHVQDDYIRALTDVEPDAISPLQLWSAHPVATPNAAFIMSALFPVFSTFVVVIAYVAVRKVYRVLFPDKLLVQRITGVSEDEEHLFALKRNLTMFEIATGAALQNRYGVVADYDNCLYVQGVKYASADGIYSSGYVIASGKFLTQTEDLVSIWLMKILRKRFRNVYVYEVDGTTVKQQARLVYPETMSFRELFSLNIDVLS